MTVHVSLLADGIFQKTSDVFLIMTIHVVVGYVVMLTLYAYLFYALKNHGLEGFKVVRLST